MRKFLIHIIFQTYSSNIFHDNEVMVCENASGYGGFKMEYLVDRFINKSKLKVPRKNGKQVLLKRKR